MPAVSIIMNVRNGAATLRAAIASVLAQTEVGWELIVWDDCSTDDSARIVAEFDDPRIRYVLAPQETSLGQARDAAIGHAQGEWLAFLDQDDLWLPRKLEQQLPLTAGPRVGLVYGRTLCFYPDGSQRDCDPFHEFGPLPEGDIVAELLGKGCFIVMSSVLLRRAAAQQVGGVPPNVHITPDYFLYVAIGSKFTARAVQDVVCRYRIHPGTMTSVYRGESQKETLQLLDEWRTHLAPSRYAARRAQISTAMAFEEMRRGATFLQGVRRLLHDGSLPWLAGRPFVHLWRWLARRLYQPYWKKAAEASQLKRSPEP